MVQCSLGEEEWVIGKRTEWISWGRAQGAHSSADSVTGHLHSCVCSSSMFRKLWPTTLSVFLPVEFFL